MKCPNCRSNLDLTEWWQDLMKSRWGGIACDNCPAVIHIESHVTNVTNKRGDYYLSSLLLVTILGPVSILLLTAINLLIMIPFTLIVLFLIAGLIVRSGLRVNESDASLEELDAHAEIIRMRPTCPLCGATVDFEGALTCRKCGSEVAIKETGVADTCIVCNLNLDSNDDLLFCPHCGRMAHKLHLLEWLHVKDGCPSCGGHIDEREISKQLSKLAGKWGQKR